MLRLITLWAGLWSAVSTPTALVSPTATDTPTQTRTRTRSVSMSATDTHTATATRSKGMSLTPTGTKPITQSQTETGTDTLTQTGTQTGTPTNTLTQTQTQTGTPSPTMTPTNTPTQTHTQFPQTQQTQPTETPNTQYIAIGSVMGCLVLMTFVAVAILYTNRQKRSLHYTPTTMNAVPTNGFADITTNPISTRVLFPPIQPRTPPPPFPSILTG